MSNRARILLAPRRAFTRRRGSVLLTAMLFAIALGLVLVGYLNLSRTSLKLAHRTFFATDASNLAEAGLEEAIYCFNQMTAGTAAATAWSGWTISSTNAMRTLPPFSRDQNAIGTVKVYVHGYDGTDAAPYVIAQGTITSFDGSPPIVKIVQVGLTQSGSFFTNGVVGISGVSLSGKPSFDSFNSNPSNSATGPWLAYSAALAQTNTTVIVPSGSVSLGSGKINGNLLLGASVTAPPASQVTGTIKTNYTGTFPLPTYPTAASVSKSYNLGSSLPALLPAVGHVPAADGRYYYFVSGATIGNTAIAAGKNVTIVGTTTSLSSGLSIGTNATCKIYMDGIINASGHGAINNGGNGGNNQTGNNSGNNSGDPNWAGSLQIFTSTAGTCQISGNGDLQACVLAPNATLSVAGGGSLVGSFTAKTVTASGNVGFHYDEALKFVSIGGSSAGGAKLTSWFERQSSADRSAVAALTNNFLP